LYEGPRDAFPLLGLGLLMICELLLLQAPGTGPLGVLFCEKELETKKENAKKEAEILRSEAFFILDRVLTGAVAILVGCFMKSSKDIFKLQIYALFK
jgi:hypothetical protein